MTLKSTRIGISGVAGCTSSKKGPVPLRLELYLIWLVLWLPRQRLLCGTRHRESSYLEFFLDINYVRWKYYGHFDHTEFETLADLMAMIWGIAPLSSVVGSQGCDLRMDHAIFIVISYNTIHSKGALSIGDFSGGVCGYRCNIATQNASGTQHFSLVHMDTFAQHRTRCSQPWQQNSVRQYILQPTGLFP